MPALLSTGLDTSWQLTRYNLEELRSDICRWGKTPTFQKNSLGLKRRHLLVNLVSTGVDKFAIIKIEGCDRY